MALYSERTGKKITYQDLANRTGISRATIETLGSRTDYNTTLSTIDTLCKALQCDLTEIIDYSANEITDRDIHGDKD